MSTRHLNRVKSRHPGVNRFDAAVKRHLDGDFDSALEGYDEIIKKYPGYVKGSNCDNCLQLQGPPGNSYRPCSLFQGKLVAVGGWCSGWTAEV